MNILFQSKNLRDFPIYTQPLILNLTKLKLNQKCCFTVYCLGDLFIHTHVLLVYATFAKTMTVKGPLVKFVKEFAYNRIY